MRTILIVGGAGYIGSHMVKLLASQGFGVTVLDNLCNGHREAVTQGELVVGDAGDNALLDRLFLQTRFDAVMHFASHIQVGESVSDPGKYYENNVNQTVALLNAMIRHRVDYFIFSSTAAIFGEPDYTPIDEQHPEQPLNPYGKSKWMVERLLTDYHAAYGLHYGCLRYFNAAGADPEGQLGECHEPETHLIPLVLQAASGRRKNITIFGDDYPTPDGTCIRDYIHILDLCQAHLQLMDYLWKGGEERQFNLGTGKGYSVREIIKTAEKISGKTIPVEMANRRPGDPAVLVADGSKARKILNWTPAYSDLETILKHAWAWEEKLKGR